VDELAGRRAAVVVGAPLTTRARPFLNTICSHTIWLRCRPSVKTIWLPLVDALRTRLMTPSKRSAGIDDFDISHRIASYAAVRTWLSGPRGSMVEPFGLGGGLTSRASIAAELSALWNSR